MLWIVFLLPCLLFLMGFIVRYFPYSANQPADSYNRFKSTHGINISFIDLTQDQWIYLSLRLAPKLFTGFAIVNLVVNLLLFTFDSTFNLNSAIVITIILFIAAFFVGVVKADKYQSSTKN